MRNIFNKTNVPYLVPELQWLNFTRAITAADLLNDRVIPLLRILTDRGTEYCGKPENHSFIWA